MKKHSVHLSSFKQILHKYAYFIFDCDGVVWNENVYINETIESIKHLNKMNKNIFFLSNVNRSSRKELHNKILKGGMDSVDIKHVYSASSLAARYLKVNYSHVKNIYLIGRQGLQDELEGVGIKVFGGASDDDRRLSVREVKKMELNKDIQAVVCGSDDYINYYKLSYAANVAYRSKLLFGTNYDIHAKVGEIIVPGAYSFISTIETISEVNAKIIAKPNKEALNIIFKDNLINLAENSIEYIPEEIRKQTLMIGDTIRTDIKFAENCKIDSLLLVEDLNKIPELIKIQKETKNDEIINPIPTYIMNKLKL